MTFPQVAQHPASVEAYIRHGWSLVPVPPMTKGPQHAGWNRKENVLQSHTQLPSGWGIGLAHAYSGTMAVDVDVWDRAAFELMMHGINLQALYEAPDAVIIDSGRQGHGKLLYAMPFGMVLPSKKFIDQYPDGKRYNYLDLRCGTANGLTVQDVMPPSIHPDTRQPYRWAGRGHWTRLPIIPSELLKFWTDSMAQDQRQQVDAPVSADWDEIRDALNHISPDCSRDEWISVGMALHHAGTSGNCLDYALQLWDEWSQPSDKYPGPRDLATQWRSFRSDKATKVRLPSLFRLAKQGGWEKPPPDVSTMFVPIEQVTPPPQVTFELRPPPPELDLSLVPQVLRQRAEEIGVGVGCDPLVPLFAGIAAVSGAMDARSRLELKPGFKVPPVLWIMTIGDPADKKTPGSRPMFDVLNTLEVEDRSRYAQAMQQFEAMEARFEAARKAFLDAATDTEALLSGEMPPGYGDPPPKPAPLKIVVQDITSQKLVRQAADMPRGLLCYLDEMLSWSRKITDPRSMEARSAWTQSYEASRYEMDRVGAGTINAENFAVSIYGNLQPHVFSEVVKAMSDDGLIQRFMPIVLRHHHTRKGRPTNSVVAQQQYEQMVRLVFGLPAMTFTLSPEAAKVFDEFQDWYEQTKVDERTLHSGPVFMTAFGKLEGLVGRLALVWHVMENPFSAQVSGKTMEQVTRLVRGYLVPVLRYAFDSELGGVTGFDQWCADHIIHYSDHPTITMSEIKQSARRQLTGMSVWGADQMVLQAMYLLEQAGWVVRMDDGSRLNQHHAQWGIHPQLNTIFKDHRRKVIEAKQRRMDDIYRLSTKEKPKVHGYEDAA